MSGTILRRRARTARPPRVEHYSSAVNTSTTGAVEHVTVMRAAKRSNVRAGPGTSYAKVGLLEVGEEVRVIERTGDWFQLEPHPGQPERYVYAPLLTAARHQE